MPFSPEQTKQIKIADTSSSLQTEPFADTSCPLPNAFSQLEKSLSEPVIPTFQPAVMTLMYLMTQMIHLIT